MLPNSWLGQVRTLTNAFFGFLFPPVCANCRKVGALICADCLADVPWITNSICSLCGRVTAVSTPCCPVCQRHPLPLQQIRAAVLFDDIIPHLIHQMKYNGAFALATPLADLMVDAWPLWQCAVDVVMPVPLHRDRQKKRGYNQSELLVERFCQRLNIASDIHHLRRTRATPPQVGLDAADRRTNVQGAFNVIGDFVRDKQVLLVDDVCTTGSTLGAATAALLQAGATTVSAYCVARAT
jgi:ComF family protein